MRALDVLRFAWGSLRGYPSRTVLMVLAMAIGVGAVVVLTALGEGARVYVVNQFASLGTNLLIVFPGRTETGGVAPGMFLGQTPRDLTLEDALALTRSPRCTGGAAGGRLGARLFRRAQPRSADPRHHRRLAARSATWRWRRAAFCRLATRALPRRCA